MMSERGQVDDSEPLDTVIVDMWWDLRKASRLFSKSISAAALTDPPSAESRRTSAETFGVDWTAVASSCAFRYGKDSTLH